MRVEDYSDSSRIATPKLGVNIQPIKALELKASWGRSYKLPTLFQQYGSYSAVLLSAASYGYGANSTYIYALGSNSKDQAEHSENLTLSAEFRPTPNAELMVDYFHINYTGRVAAPISNYIGALTNPIYASLITLNPTAAQQAAIIAGALGGLQNGAGIAYNAANVVAILNGLDQNIARQLYKGVDVSGRYRVDLADRTRLDLTGSASWLTSRQQLLAGLPWTQLAGTVFQPTHFKARGGATFTYGKASVSSFVNYTGGVLDNRITPAVWVHSVTTVDLTARFELPGRIDIGLNATNLFNAKPAVIYHTSAYDTSFDTTNYSAIGRYLGLSISRKW